MFIEILKNLFLRFLALWPKIRFYSFLCTSRILIDQMTWNVACMYIVMVCIFVFIFNFIIVIFFPVLPKMLFSYNTTSDVPITKKSADHRSNHNFSQKPITDHPISISIRSLWALRWLLNNFLNHGLVVLEINTNY